MSFQHKPNSGSIFKNDRREKDTDPNAKGDALIDGVEYFISAWTNKDKNGNPYQKLSFTKKDEAHRTGMDTAKQALDDDDPPF